MTSGILVAHTSWRYIYVLQAAMATLGLILSVIVIPKDPQISLPSAESNEPSTNWWSKIQLFNPVPTLRLFGDREVFYLVSIPLNSRNVKRSVLLYLFVYYSVRTFGLHNL